MSQKAPEKQQMHNVDINQNPPKRQESLVEVTTVTSAPLFPVIDKTLISYAKTYFRDESDATRSEETSTSYLSGKFCSLPRGVLWKRKRISRGR